MSIDSDIRILWDYLHMRHRLKKADAIMVFGCHDDGVAEHSVRLFKDGWAPSLVFSGGLGKITEGSLNTTEAERFANIAKKRGIDTENILIENKSTNTRENVLFTRQLLNHNKIKIKKIIIVTKPYMERRAHATFKKFWPEVDVIASSQKVSLNNYLDSYPRGGVSRKDTISLIVGDLNRMLVLPDLGLQVKQKIPTKVLTSYQNLIKAGYDKYLWK